jgi:hypothetical protein
MVKMKKNWKKKTLKLNNVEDLLTKSLKNVF